MFLHDAEHSGRPIVISQSSHAWLAWQLACHWGNRRFSRPLPKSEVLAAVMLHDSGWAEFDAAPDVDASGRPRTFDHMQPEEHLRIWRTSIVRTAQISRYAAVLVASHFAGMAESKRASLLEHGDEAGAQLVEGFRDETERSERAWVDALADDPRYRDGLSPQRRRANEAILTLADRVSVYLCAALASDFRVEAPVDREPPRQIALRSIDRRRWRVDPWPMQGDRVRLQCEGRRLPSHHFESSREFRAVFDQAPVERLSFTLLRPSAIG